MAEKLVTRELGSRWVPHPVSGTASTENEPLAPRRPVAAARASFPLKLVFEAVSPPGRPPAPPAAPGSGKRGRRRAGPRCRPLPSWPLPSPTPTAPAPHPRDPPGAARPPPGYTTRPGAGGGAAGAGRPQCGGPGRGRRGSRAVGPGVPCGLPHPSPPPLLCRPESVTGIGFQHGGQEAAPRGGENIPASPAMRRAGQGRRPPEEPRGQTAGPGARQGRLGVKMTPGTKGSPPPPRQQTPRPQVG